MGYSRTTQAMIERHAGMVDKPKPVVTKVACQRHDRVICACIAPCPACACLSKIKKADFNTPFEAKLKGVTLR